MRFTKIPTFTLSLLFGIFLLSLHSHSQAQEIRTSYFMNSAFSHKLNPALQPHRGYIGIVLGNTSFQIGTGATFNNIFFPLGDSVVSFLHPEMTRNHKASKLLDKKITPYFEFDWTILSTGFYVKDGSFISYDMNLRQSSILSIPRGLFEFIQEGSSNKAYDLDFEFVSNMYIEHALGYSRRMNDIDDKLVLGAKLKLLSGLESMDFRMDGSSITANENIWKLSLNGKMSASLPSSLSDQLPSDLLPNQNGSSNQFNINDLLFSGLGLGVDLGATYELLDNLLLAASITDLGFISWKSPNYYTSLNNYNVEFTGINLSNLDSLDLSQIYKDNIEELKDALELKEDNRRKTTYLHSNFTLGGQYSILDNKLGFGLLYKTKATPIKWFHTITGSVNYRPFKPLNVALSYSILENFNSIGFALNYRPKYFLNLFVGVDYIPLQYSSQYIPLYYRASNLQFGIVIPLTTKPEKAPTPKSYL